MRWSWAVFVGTVWLAGGARAQIAPECQGVEVPADYDENAQQSFLQNYFAASFLQTPMAPPVPYDDAAGGHAGVGLELGFIPPLSCERRLVLAGTKTEETNTSPVSPRPRLLAQLPRLGPVSSHLGFTFVPPVPSPIGTLLQAGGEIGVGTRFDFGLSLGLRGHLTFARMRAVIATPFDPDEPAVDDLFFANVMGLDLAAGYTLPLSQWWSLSWLTITPYASAGVADVSTLFLVGDDNVIVQNVDTPYAGALVAVGVQALFVEHLEVVVEGSWALPIYPTVKLKLGVVW
jgi:hypothetical protein